MISLIVAIGKDGLIGKDNSLPWSYPEDLKYFRNTTRAHTVIMGENTFYSIVSMSGHPLKKRKNIVATLNKDFKPEKQYMGEEYDIEVVYDFIDFLKNNKNEEEMFIIGGKQIYSLSLDYVDRMYITHVNKDYEGNVYFPKIDYSKFNKIKSSFSGDLEFAVYERIKK